MSKTYFGFASLFALFLTFCSIQSFSQQIPYLNHYFYDSYLLNPADAGESEHIRASLFFRQQWAGIPGAPETQSLIVHGKIPNRNFGLGLNITNDATDILSRFSALTSVSYTVHLASEHMLSFGMSAGMLRYQLNFDKIRADVSDEGLLKNASNTTRLEGTAGFSYRFKNLNLGFVSEQIFNRTFTFVNEADQKNISFRLVRHYTLYAGHEFLINSNFSVCPLLMLRSAQGLSSQVDINATLKFKALAWVNLQHRVNSGSGISVGAAITKQINIGYTYEIPVAPIRSVASASHEVMLAMRFAPQKRRVSSTSSSAGQSENQSQGTQSASDEQLDELRQKNEQLQEKMLEQKKALEHQRNEIESLRNNMNAVEVEMREMIRKDSVDLGAEKQFDESSEYMVVIGAVKKLSEARSYQKMIQREFGIDSDVRHNHLESWYFVFSHIVKSNREATEEIKRLREKGIEELIVGNPWVYKAKKKR